MQVQGMSPYVKEDEITQEASVRCSKLPKLLGWTHLVMAALGIWALIQSLQSEGSILDQTNARLMEAGMKPLELSNESIQSLSSAEMGNDIFLCFGGISTLALIAAGIGLVQYRRWGRVCTHVYVGAAMFAKMASLYLVTVAMLPIYEAMVAANEELAVVGVDGLRIAAVVSVLFTSIYLIVSLILVNLKRVRHCLQ